MSRRVRVAVLMGGRSSEHEISLASARSVLESLDPAEYDVVTGRRDSAVRTLVTTEGERFRVATVSAGSG